MASSLNKVAPLVALLFLFAITTTTSSQGLGGLLGGLLGGGGGGGGGGIGGLLGGATSGILGGVTGLTNITGNLLCSPNLILCPIFGSCPPLANATISLNLGNLVLVQNVTNASGVFQLNSALPILNILNNLPMLSLRVTLPAIGCNTLPVTGVLSSPLAITQVLGKLLNVVPTGFLLG